MLDDIFDDEDQVYREEVVVNTGYVPRPLQAEIHPLIKRFSVLAIHRRFGKTVFAINHGIDVGLKCTKLNPQVSFVSPLYKQSKNVAWQYLKDATYMIPNSKSYESELKVMIPLSDLDGKPNVLTIQLFGADNPDSLRGMYHDFVIFDEFGNQPIVIWTEVVSPALADRKGGALFLGTPNGKNHFYDVYQKALSKMAEGDDQWFAATYGADTSGVLPEEELQAQQDNLSDEEYRQEFLCDWSASVRGAYYSAQLARARKEGRMLRIPHESGLPVFCAFDIGVDDYTACWFFQCFANEIRCIRYEQWQNMGLLDVMKEVSHLPYIYGTIYLPWDAKQRERSSGKQVYTLIEELGFEVWVVERQTMKSGIERVREIFTQVYFDEVMCAVGIDCLENYSKKINPKTKEYMDIPNHDKYSHGADAFRYLAQAYDPYLGQQFIANQSKFNRAPKGTVKRSID